MANNTNKVVNFYQKFHFGTEVLNIDVSKNRWSGFGMATVGIHPNHFELHPNPIPTGHVL